MTHEPQDYHYKECGLDYVYLRGGVEKHSTRYGEGVSIMDIDGLHKAIAKQVATGPNPIRGQEVRFLRSILQVSQAGLGEMMACDRSTVSRWEGTPNDPIPEQAARLLRFYAATFIEGNKACIEVVELLRDQDELEHGTLQVTLGYDHGWRRAAA